MHKSPFLMKFTSSISEALFENVAKAPAAALILVLLVMNRNTIQLCIEELLFGTLIHAVSIIVVSKTSALFSCGHVTIHVTLLIKLARSVSAKSEHIGGEGVVVAVLAWFQAPRLLLLYSNTGLALSTGRPPEAQ